MITILAIFGSCGGSSDDPKPTPNKPTISLDNADEEIVVPGATFSIKITASQGDAPITDLDITTPNDRQSVSYDDESSIEYTFQDTAPLNKGTYHYSFTVYDRDGKTASVSKNIIVEQELVVFDIDESAVPDEINVGETVTLKGTVTVSGGIHSMVLSSSEPVQDYEFKSAVDEETFTFEHEYEPSVSPGQVNMRIHVVSKLDITRPYVWTGKQITVLSQATDEYATTLETQLAADQKSFFDASNGVVMSKTEAASSPSVVDLALYEMDGKFYLAGPKSVPSGTFDGWSNDRKTDLMPALTDERKAIFDTPSTVDINKAFIEYKFEDPNNNPEDPVELIVDGIYLVQTFNKNRDGVLKVTSIDAANHKVEMTLKFIDL